MWVLFGVLERIDSNCCISNRDNCFRILDIVGLMLIMLIIIICRVDKPSFPAYWRCVRWCLQPDCILPVQLLISGGDASSSDADHQVVSAGAGTLHTFYQSWAGAFYTALLSLRRAHPSRGGGVDPIQHRHYREELIVSEWNMEREWGHCRCHIVKS